MNSTTLTCQSCNGKFSNCVSCGGTGKVTREARYYFLGEETAFEPVQILGPFRVCAVNTISRTAAIIGGFSDRRSAQRLANEVWHEPHSHGDMRLIYENGDFKGGVANIPVSNSVWEEARSIASNAL